MAFRKNNRRNSYPMCFFNGAFTDRKCDAEVQESRGLLEMNPLINSGSEAAKSDDEENKVDAHLEYAKKARNSSSRFSSAEQSSKLGIEMSRSYLSSEGLTNQHRMSESRVPLRRCHSDNQQIKRVGSKKNKQTFKNKIQESLASWKRKSQPKDVNSCETFMHKLQRKNSHDSANKDWDIHTNTGFAHQLRWKSSAFSSDTDSLGLRRKKSYTEDEVLDTLTPLPVIVNRMEPKPLYKRSLSEPLMHIGSLFSSGIYLNVSYTVGEQWWYSILDGAYINL